MRLLADEYVPPAIVSALRGEGHDVAVIGDDVDLGSEDTVLLELFSTFQATGCDYFTAPETW